MKMRDLEMMDLEMMDLEMMDLEMMIAGFDGDESRWKRLRRPTRKYRIEWTVPFLQRKFSPQALQSGVESRGFPWTGPVGCSTLIAGMGCSPPIPKPRR
jgi:hypothetical protein